MTSTHARANHRMLDTDELGELRRDHRAPSS
jgi:hypothetical protein